MHNVQKKTHTWPGMLALYAKHYKINAQFNINSLLYLTLCTHHHRVSLRARLSILRVIIGLGGGDYTRVRVKSAVATKSRPLIFQRRIMF